MNELCASRTCGSLDKNADEVTVTVLCWNASLMKLGMYCRLLAVADGSEILMEPWGVLLKSAACHVKVERDTQIFPLHLSVPGVYSFRWKGYVLLH